MSSYIYKIWNEINDKLYIGQTSLSIDYRFKQHCHDAKRRSYEQRPLYLAMNKYGFDKFHIELIEECDSDCVLEREIYWINYYNTYSYGYNATLGGKGITLYDYDSFCELYEQGYTLKQIGEQLHCDSGHVGEVLRTLGYDTSINIKNYNSKPVVAYDKQGNLVESFKSTKEAAQWLIDNGVTTQQCLESARAAIGRVANGKRKTAYNYIWKRN